MITMLAPVRACQLPIVRRRSDADVCKPGAIGIDLGSLGDVPQPA
jgi:hypothetical protein